MWGVLVDLWGDDSPETVYCDTYPEAVGKAEHLGSEGIRVLAVEPIPVPAQLEYV